MKTNIATTSDQSQRLLRCGVSADTADMALADGNILLTAPYSEMRDRFNEKDCSPSWSLSRLLELLPKEMGIAVGAYPGCDKYTCFTLIDPDIEPIVADTAIEATMQMIEQLMNNGYKLDEK